MRFWQARGDLPVEDGRGRVVSVLRSRLAILADNTEISCKKNDGKLTLAISPKYPQAIHVIALVALQTRWRSNPFLRPPQHRPPACASPPFSRLHYVYCTACATRPILYSNLLCLGTTQILWAI